MSYAYLGVSGTTHSYAVTLKLFMRCNSGRQFPDPTIVSVFDKQTGSRLWDISVPVSQRETLQFTPNDPCIDNPPSVCYELAYYIFTVNLPASTSGFVLASEVNYRIRGISNTSTEQVGATYTAEIPGTIPVASGPANSSALFTGTDLVVVCANNPFSYSFGATDVNGDRIRYSFCTAYNSSSSQNNGNPPGPPPYSPLNYNGPQFSADAPLGSNVTIDPNTGLISGIAPEEGIYVVTVCAEEIRDNQVIAVQRKDLQINITSCSIASARLEQDYMLCRDSRQLTFQNLSNSPLIVTWNWELLDVNRNLIASSTAPDFPYSFAIDGRYTIRLVVNRNQSCADSTEAPVFVYPGMQTRFDFTGICVGRPTQFTDRSSLRTGTLTSWHWDFGEVTLRDDTSRLQNPTFTYPGLGEKAVVLTVTASNGCRDTAQGLVPIITKPTITLGFRDSLICRNDAVTLLASGNGQFSWTPAAGMLQPFIATPSVSPATTTKYIVTLDAGGCVNTDSVLVRVVDFVTLEVMPDSVICQGDTARLRIQSDGLQYTWTPASQVITPDVSQPLVVASNNTVFSVTARIGGCSATASIQLQTVPYPAVDAGRDTVICYNTAATLMGQTNGDRWAWSPPSSLISSTALQTTAWPSQTTAYTLTAFRPFSGCPKPASDTVLITVLPRIRAVVGNDTAVLINQPLQLQAGGGVAYQWNPAIYLNDASLSNPVAVFEQAAEAIRFRVQVFNELGCFETAQQEVKIFATPPTVFVPTAFTPDGNGRNDELKPIAVGMTEIKRFSVYNRWGQLVFSTSINGKGWDGRIQGQLQASNTYVWWVEAIDYLGKPYFLKGTSTLIR